MNWKESPIFILGYSKSGTSLLNAILDNHPQLVVLPEETDYFDVMFDFLRKLGKSNSYNKEAAVDLISEILLTRTHLRNLAKGKVAEDIGGNFDYSEFDFESFANCLKISLKNNPINNKNVLLNLVNSFFKTSHLKYDNVKGWVEKTPYHELNVKNRIFAITEMFPSAKFIFIFRDPRDNFIAYKKKHANLTVEEFVYEWKRIYKIFLKYNSRKNILALRYEDIVSDTNTCLEKLKSFLEIHNSEVLSMPSKYGIPWSGNSMFGLKTFEISSGSLNRYLNYKNKKDIKKIEVLLYNQMRELTYSIPSNKNPNFFLLYKTNYIIHIIKRVGFVFKVYLKNNYRNTHLIKKIK